MSAPVPVDKRDVPPARCDDPAWRRTTQQSGATMRALIGWCGLALLAPAAPVSAQTPWLLNLHTGVNYSNNVRFRSGTQRQPRGLVGTLGGGLTHTFAGADSSLNVGVHANSLFFKNLSELNRVTYAANVGYTRPLSDNTSLNVSDQFASSYNTLLDDLATEGVFLPLAGTKRNHAVVDLDHQISERTTMDFSVRHDLFFFRNVSDSDFETDLIDGWRLGATLRFGRQFSADQTGSFNLGYTRNGRTANIPNVYSTGIGWQQALGPRLFVAGDVGVSTARSATASATRGTGSASVAWRLWQGSVHGSFHRTMGLGLGLGRVRVRESFALGLNQILWRRAQLSITARRVSNGDPLDSLFEHNVQSLSVGLGMKIVGSLRLATGYSYVKRQGGGTTSGLRGGLQFSYHTAF